ncbi:MAG TPA: sigma-70 family RNA polymerase sigma factor [Pyrinomonadaceae bacterium]
MDYSTAWQDKNFMPDADAESAEIAARAENSDRRLVELVLAGDETAFEQIFERYKRLAAAIASRYFRRPEQIEEIIQISFTKVYFELKNFRGAHDASLASWLARITTNACLDALRSQNRKSENLLCELSEPEIEILFAAAPTVVENTEKSLVERDLAEKLLSRLAADDRAILQMLDAEEMSVSEVAEITGWSCSKIKIRAFRARNALRKVLRKFL